MTDGHKHRMVRVPSWDRWYVRLLRKRVYHSRDLHRVDASPYPYGPCDHDNSCWVLTPLGVLHRWTGLTLEVK